MATTKINTRDEIIRIGAQLIHSQGYKATGLQQILDVAGIPKGSFYFYFKPLDRLNNLLDFYESALKKSGASLGCPIANLSLELADTNEELRKHLQAAVEGFIAQIESCLEEAQKSRQLKSGVNTADTARFIFHGLEGAILHMKVAKSMDPLRTFRRYLNTYLAENQKKHA
jgi:TetR/AcrR family transcriptional repressor of nem operon